MKNDFAINSAPLLSYIADHCVEETAAQQALRERTAHLELAIMQISPIQAQLLRFLVQLIGAQNCLEVGTFCGYSSLVIAEALPDNGQLITCDINEKWTQYAQEAWQKANVTNKVRLMLGDARVSLNTLVESQQNAFDLIFIDADKTGYPEYYELSLTLCRPKGLILIDNIFWDGQVLDNNSNCRQTRAIQQLNNTIKNDCRVNRSIVPVADGLFLVQKK